MFDLEREIGVWRGRLAAKGSLSQEALEELEGHLREECEDLASRGLDPEEAFIVSLKRVGNLDKLAKEFSRLSSEELWKNLVIGRGEPREALREILITALLALAAGFAAKLPFLFGLRDKDEILYIIKNAFLLFVPMIAFGILLIRREGFRAILAAAAFYALAALPLNLYPWVREGQTLVLSAIHLPILVWLSLLPPYCGSEWRKPERRMDFVRFTGECFLYGVLILCGVGVFSFFVMMIFDSIGIELEDFVQEWILIVLAAAAPVIAARLAQAKRNVIENIAPVLAKIFGPLFLAALTVFLIVLVVSGKRPFAERDVLIAFDIALALVLALILYTISSRDSRDSPGFFDWVNAALAISALLIDVFALAAIAQRIGAFGFSPNKTAALGENILLFIDLGVLAGLYIRYLITGKYFTSIIRWQTACLSAFAAWALIVAFGFPLVFSFV